MAVDYGKSKTVSAPVATATTAVVESIKALDKSYAVQDGMFVENKPTERDVFLALLIAHTTAAGGSKYWGVTKNVPGNVSRLKSLAQQIVEAY